MQDFLRVNRRRFLQRACQGASLAMVPAGLRDFSFPALDSLFSPAELSPEPFSGPASGGGFHLDPRYRNNRPLDAMLLKARAGSDQFVTEKYVDQIDAILAEWSSGLLQSPDNVQVIEKHFTADFSGLTLRPAESNPLRPGSSIEVYRGIFPDQPWLDSAVLDQEAFRKELRSMVDPFSAMVTAEFQVTSITTDSESPSQPARRVNTLVRYELVGTGSGFHKEQRVGTWNLEWKIAAGTFEIRRWRTLEETKCRSASPVFVDVTASMLGGNASYSAQMLRGIDHWRTILDGACGIDIYGHNGVSLADIDNDGLDDLYVCQPAGLPNRLYRNLGDGTFEDITEASGLGILESTTCALFADFENAGRQDAVVVRADGPLLFVNDGHGRFRRKPDAFEFSNAPQGTFTGAALADYDRDGWLDIYFCLYAYYQGTDQYRFPLPYHDAENGPPNFMMRNNRDGTFRDVTQEARLHHNNTRYSFCCGWGDYNQDGWPDLYVANDFGRKNLYRNNGDGTFTDTAANAGVEDVGAGMSVGWFDYDNDCAEDLYVADMWTAAGERISAQEIFKKDSPDSVRALYRKHAIGNSLFRNAAPSNRDGRFEDKTQPSRVGFGRWAWSSDAFDFDHDGFRDLYIANGMVSGPSREDLNSFFWRQVVGNSPDSTRSANDYEQGWSAINELIRADGTWSGYERNVFYANNRDGTFSDVSGAVDLDFIEDGRSFALCDFDGDGRQEVFLKNRNGPQLRILRNVIEGLPPSIAFRLRGTKSNRDAIGAVVTLETGGGRQTRTLQAGSGFLAQHSKEILFGLGEAQGQVRASIRWPTGLIQELHDLPPQHRIWVQEGSGKVRIEPFKAPVSSRFGGSMQRMEALPTKAETWLLSPVAAPKFSLSDLAGQVRSLDALRGKALLLHFWIIQSLECRSQLKMFNEVRARWNSLGLSLLSMNVDAPTDLEALKNFAKAQRLSFPVLPASEDVAGVYNVFYRYLFDRRRDLPLPTSFLIDQRGHIVKVYQGPVDAKQVEQDLQDIPQTAPERLTRALPFLGVSETFEYGRNYLSYGANFFQRGYLDQAAESFQLALHDDPSSAEAWYGLGSAYLNLEKTAEARESFERATKLKASYPDTLANAWNNLGLIEAQEGRTEEAIASFQKALQLKPEHLIALNNLGNAYRKLRRWEDARKTFEQALAAGPGDADANYGLGMVFAQADDTARASEYLQKALLLRPGYAEALNNLGILLLRTQRRDDAVAKFEECIRVAPQFDQSYLNLARVYVLEGARDKAREVLLALLKQHPGHAQAQKLLAELPE